MLQMNDLIFKIKAKPYLMPIIVVCVGVLILLLFSGKPTAQKSESEELYDPYEYTTKLEKKLKKHILALEAVNSCEVMITLSSLENNDYLENFSVSSNRSEDSEQYSRQNEYLVIDEDGNDSVIIEKINAPQICGALVIYNGKTDVETQKNIIDAVTTVLGLQSNKVCVVSN